MQYTLKDSSRKSFYITEIFQKWLNHNAQRQPEMLHTVKLEVEELFMVKKGLIFGMESFFQFLEEVFFLLTDLNVFCSQFTITKFNNQLSQNLGSQLAISVVFWYAGLHTQVVLHACIFYMSMPKFAINLNTVSNIERFLL